MSRVPIVQFPTLCLSSVASPGPRSFTPHQPSQVPITTPASSFHGFPRPPFEKQCPADHWSNFLIHSLLSSPHCFHFARVSISRAMKLGLEKNYAIQDHHAISVAKRWSTLEEDCQICYHDRLLGSIPSALMAVVRFWPSALPCFAWFVAGHSEFAGLSGFTGDSFRC